MTTIATTNGSYVKYFRSNKHRKYMLVWPDAIDYLTAERARRAKRKWEKTGKIMSWECKRKSH